MIKYWFSLNSETFLWKSEKKVLLYNALTHKSLTFDNNTFLNEIIIQLQDLDNLYCVELTEKERDSDYLKTFINDTLRSGSGDIVKAAREMRKPVFLPPVLKLQCTMGKVDPYVMNNSNMLLYLHELCIYVNEESSDNSNSSVKLSKTTNINFNDLLKFIKSVINCSSLHVINLCGDKLFEYPSFDLLISELNQYNVTKRIYLKLEYLPRSLVKLMRWKEEIDQVKISIDPDFDLEKLLYFFNLIENANIECFWQFNISSELNYNEVEDFIDMYKLENYEILPFFNGNNYDFFEEFVFLTEEEIQCNQLTKREIFAHQVLNTNNFGKLTLKADGNVYANIHQPPLGTINDSVNEMICKELNSTSSWLRIRNNILPCSNCLYKWLCPSPSDYEHVIGKPNLCHVIT